jgi:hypothetical protein
VCVCVCSTGWRASQWKTKANVYNRSTVYKWWCGYAHGNASERCRVHHRSAESYAIALDKHCLLLTQVDFPGYNELTDASVVALAQSFP